jgi:hypothetical protein
MDLLPVVEVASRLRNLQPDNPPLFLIAGSDPSNYSALLKEYAQRRDAGDLLLMRTNVAPEEKPRYHEAADIFFSPSDNLQETFGITILEAMASSLPVVASDFSGYRELVVNGITGFCIPTYWGPAADDVERLSGILYGNVHNFYLSQCIAPDLEKAIDALHRLLCDDALRLELGRAGRRRAEEEYGWKRIIRMHEEYWSGLAEKAQEQPRQPAPDPFQVPYYKLFGHYVTRPLSAGDKLLIADGGVRLLGKASSLPLYPELANLISADVLRHILVLCRHQARSVSFVQERVAAARRTSPETISYHLLWALKHGLLRREL